MHQQWLYFLKQIHYIQNIRCLPHQRLWVSWFVSNMAQGCIDMYLNQIFCIPHMLYHKAHSYHHEINGVRLHVSQLEGLSMDSSYCQWCDKSEKGIPGIQLLECENNIIITKQIVNHLTVWVLVKPPVFFLSSTDSILVANARKCEIQMNFIVHKDNNMSKLLLFQCLYCC